MEEPAGVGGGEPPKRRVCRVLFTVEYDDGDCRKFELAGSDLDLSVEWSRPSVRVDLGVFQYIMQPGPLTTLIVKVERDVNKNSG